MYGVDLAVQLENLMPATGLGFLLAVVYDIIRFLRCAFSKGTVFVFITDFLFVIFCTLSSFMLFLAVNSGKIRIYLILAEIFAAAVYRLTVGKLIFAIAEKTGNFVKKLYVGFFSPVKTVFAAIIKKVRKIAVLLTKFLKKSKINSKKPLKDSNQM